MDRCFRAVVELTPTLESEVGISSSEYRFMAFTGGGANCAGHVVGGINTTKARDRLRNQWDLRRLTFADSAKPAIAVFDFECDGPIIPDEEVTYQLGLDFYINARTFGEARYVFRHVRFI